MPDDNRFANIAVEDEEADADASDDAAEDASDGEAVATETTGASETPVAESTESEPADAGADEPTDAPDASSANEDGPIDAVDTGDGEGNAVEGAETGAAPAVDPADAGPAFPFDDVRQKAVYPRPESWDAREEALDFEVKRALRDHGVKDVTGREIDDAVARTIPEVTDLVVEKVLEARRRKFD